MLPWVYQAKGGRQMFQIGDKVVYPMHGAGVIEAIEEKEVLGERQLYYVMRLPVGDMKMLIPVAGVEESGLRRIAEEAELQEVFEILGDNSEKVQVNWNKRYRANLEKLKTGNLQAVAEVVRSLSARHQAKGLSSGERRMLENARQILLSELILARDLEEAQAEALLDQALAH